MPVLKLRLPASDDVRRLPMREWPDLQSLHMQLVALPDIELPSAYTLKYADSDGDFVSIKSNADLQEAISTMGGAGLLNLIVVETSLGSVRRPTSPLPRVSPAHSLPATSPAASSSVPPRPQMSAPPFTSGSSSTSTQLVSHHLTQQPAGATFNHCGVCFAPPFPGHQFCAACGAPLSAASPIKFDAPTSSASKGVQRFSEHDLDIGAGFSQVVLGSGSYGRVVKGKINRTGEQVAIKLFDQILPRLSLAELS